MGTYGVLLECYVYLSLYKLRFGCHTKCGNKTHSQLKCNIWQKGTHALVTSLSPIFKIAITREKAKSVLRKADSLGKILQVISPSRIHTSIAREKDILWSAGGYTYNNAALPNQVYVKIIHLLISQYMCWNATNLGKACINGVSEYMSGSSKHYEAEKMDTIQIPRSIFLFHWSFPPFFLDHPFTLKFSSLIKISAKRGGWADSTRKEKGKILLSSKWRKSGKISRESNP